MYISYRVGQFVHAEHIFHLPFKFELFLICVQIDSTFWKIPKSLANIYMVIKLSRCLATSEHCIRLSKNYVLCVFLLFYLVVYKRNFLNSLSTIVIPRQVVNLETKDCLQVRDNTKLILNLIYIQL